MQLWFVSVVSCVVSKQASNRDKEVVDDEHSLLQMPARQGTFDDVFSA